MRVSANATVDAVPIVTRWRHLPLRIQPRERLTDDDLFEFCAANGDLRIERSKEGEIIIMAPSGAETGQRNFELAGQFWAWARKDGSGLGFDSSAGFVLPNGAERAPDVSWVRRERWEALPQERREKFAPICPDFVIELRSPSDALGELQAKMAEYVENGASLGWLIDPFGKRVYVYRHGAQPEILERPANLSGDPLLRGFALDLAAIW